MLKRIVVATDFSPAAGHAVARAAWLCKHAGAELTVVHTVPERAFFDRVFHRHELDYDAIVNGAQAALQRILQDLERSHGLKSHSALRNGAAHREIAAAAAAANADVLVIGARGESESVADGGPLGGTALKSFLGAALPLLLVRRPVSGAYDKILAGVDESAAGRAVLAAALELCDSSTSCELLHAFDVPFAQRLRVQEIKESTIDAYAAGEQERCERELERLASELHARDRVRTIVVRGGSAAAVVREIRKREPDLVVLGKRARYPRPAEPQSLDSVSLTVALSDSADLLAIP